MTQVTIDEDGHVDGAIKAFKRKVLRAGILKDLRKKRYYMKPSEAKRIKAAAARRRRRAEARRKRRTSAM
ncbi:MAG: 30S ribosomal protein S21 [Gemmatimonadota bacterium]|nr:30S ribosomal protein S21 [Gemmatimonadota bacterium]